MINDPLSEEEAAPVSAVDRQLALIRYKEGVEELMKIGSKKPISNGMASHAAILFEVFFKYAERQVRFFCKNLSAEVFNSPELLIAAEKAIKDGRKLWIMLQDEPEASKFLDFLKSEKLNNSNIVLLKAPVEAQGKDFNFAVMDEKAIRLEPNRKEPKATASMNLPDVARSWVDFFDKMAVKATPLYVK